ncbi:hypothetical protein MFM001_05070 [Mycobacterium sp. MFM001]|uniref:hypothetical protein n=1 Tax=Mycobacterium sp. MFM001 TaxID=2049453 RepID=UPI000DA50A16|nr:hypothetical protein [Mycobacterium sp. MFM001]GBE64045.1 hypothetical protein MFM001_05070 [Mycobacterium sp. MFM001]
MADSALQQQLDEVQLLLVRARELFGANPIEPPTDIAPSVDASATRLREAGAGRAMQSVRP